MKPFLPALLAAVLITALAACAPAAPPPPTATAVPPTAVPTPTPVPTETPMPKPPFRVIAYLTAGMVPEVVPYQQLTHINYAFLIPNADGTFATFTNGWRLDNLVKLAHEKNVQVLISVGGWGWEKQFAAAAADPALRQKFVANLADFVNQHQLDGADIDWEYPTVGQQAKDFTALIGELRQAMPGKLLTSAAAYGSNADGIPDEAVAALDWLNVMTYDGPDHGTMKQFNDGLDYWLKRGVPPARIVMGAPFYARPNEMTYRKIVETDPALAQQDTATVSGVEIHYNGIPTIQEKTKIALEKANGMMFWTLDGDASGDLSLLKAIYDTVHK